MGRCVVLYTRLKRFKMKISLDTIQNVKPLGAPLGTREALEQVDQMIQMNLQSAVCAAHLATRVLSPTGLAVLTGAQAVFPLRGSASMVAYGLAKTATHQLVKRFVVHCVFIVVSEQMHLYAYNSLSQTLDSAPYQTVVGLLPETLNTRANRAAMPNDELWSNWTAPTTIAEQLVQWTVSNQNRPDTGSFQSIITRDHVTTWSAQVNPDAACSA